MYRGSILFSLSQDTRRGARAEALDESVLDQAQIHDARVGAARAEQCDGPGRLA